MGWSSCSHLRLNTADYGIVFLTFRVTQDVFLALIDLATFPTIECFHRVSISASIASRTSFYRSPIRELYTEC